MPLIASLLCHRRPLYSDPKPPPFRFHLRWELVPMPLAADLLEILRCPVCVQEDDDKAVLELVNESWLICQSCDRKYPIRHDIPVMLVDEGTRWQSTAVSALPESPPEPAS